MNDVIYVHVADAAEGTAPSFFETVTHSGPIAFLVLLILVGFSVASWAIIIVKFMAIRTSQNSSVEFLEHFWQSKRLDEIFARTEQIPASPLAQVFRAGYQELVKVKQREAAAAEKGKDQIGGGVENVERALRRAALAEMTELERLIPFLATVGSTAPFIGLFGTVVGIMKSFGEIGAKGSANLATVAPGIAEALIATAAGLLAAIPAVIAFNSFGSRIKVLGAEMESFSSDFMNIVRRHFF
ncbi:MAG: protein TolQ [Deltaproteobacteria bacterium]|nr:protein TolQ [Deltaproteobacteria bacterium]